MTVTIANLEDEPIFVLTYEAPFTPEDVVQAKQLSSEQRLEDTLVYRIADASQLNLTFGDVAAALQAMGGTEPGDLGDPQIETCFVGSGDMLELAADSAAQERYGMAAIDIFATVDEAIAHIRNKISGAPAE